MKSQNVYMVTIHAEHPEDNARTMQASYVTSTPPSPVLGQTAHGAAITAQWVTLPLLTSDSEQHDFAAAVGDDAEARWYESFAGAGAADPVEALRNDMKRIEQTTANRFDRLTQLFERLINDRATVQPHPVAGVVPAYVAPDPALVFNNSPEQAAAPTSPAAVAARAAAHPLMSEPAPAETLPAFGEIERGPGHRHARPDGSARSVEMTSGMMRTGGAAPLSTVFTIGMDGSLQPGSLPTVGTTLGTRSDI